MHKQSNYHIVLRGMLDVSILCHSTGARHLDIELSAEPHCNANFNFMTQYGNLIGCFNDYSYSTSVLTNGSG
ncbi:MAG: hypothetical protein IPN94_11005 [Sphingobacteriales bacterium]|nr:hypothetical protein [Sphingobacteriales bacterium]